MKKSARFKKLKDKLDREAFYDLHKAIELIKELSTANFDETIEISVKLGIDAKKEHVRGTTSLPYGTGKTKKVLVLAEGDKLKEAELAGADFAGGDDKIARIKEGWLDFDIIIATPDMMPKVSKLGKILGPRGLMPNPKAGTVTQEISKVINEVKKGRIEFKMDKTGCIHSGTGKVSFSNKKIEENITQFLKDLWEAKPSGAKGIYFKKVCLSSTMGPSIKVDLRNVAELTK
ncbi:50S ribosomal protein L1 [candidate division WOR-3 bacterium]|nr:50S ribosomal protein L1 [candidate division WOR-3 bacterium]